MEIYQDYLRTQGVQKAQILSLNFEDYDLRELREPGKLHSYVLSHAVPGKMTYVFLDEIQHVKDWQEVVDSLFIKKNLDLYITGSNACLLSGEISTLISGRYVEIRMLPLSFREYVNATGTADNLAKSYRDFTESSSFPYALELRGHPGELHDYLEGIYHTIVVKDLAARKKIPDVMMLESVARFLFDNIGSPMSAKKMADTMTSSGRKIDVKTVERYVDALMESFIVCQAKRYNVKGKQYLKTLENVVYLELLRRGYEVYVGKVDELEVDFVAMDRRGITYFQVAASVRAQDTLRRELTSLQKINDHYPKYILTLDEDPEADYEGIRRVNALEWLVGDADGSDGRKENRF